MWQLATEGRRWKKEKGKGRSVFLASAVFSQFTYCFIILRESPKLGKAELGHKTFLLQPKSHTMIAIKYIIQKLVGSFSGAAQLLLLHS